MPFNAEPPLNRLADNWLTPEELLFVRSHGPVPEIDPAAFRVSIEGLVEKPQNYSVAELRDRFPLTTATAVLTCAGNRREESSRRKASSRRAVDCGSDRQCAVDRLAALRRAESGGTESRGEVRLAGRPR